MRFLNFFNSLVPQENRRAVERLADPGIVAYFWDGGKPHANPVRDISHEGAFLETTGLWYEGTILALTLQPRAAEETSTAHSATPHLGGGDSIQVVCRVARQGTDGIAIEFPRTHPEETKKLRAFIARCAEKHSANGHAVHNDAVHKDPVPKDVVPKDVAHKDGAQPNPEKAAPVQDQEQAKTGDEDKLKTQSKENQLAMKRSQSGESLVELVLLIPVLMFLIVNVINWGGFIFAWITVTNAARSAAEYAILDNASAGAPIPATATQITNLIKADVTSLLNGSAPTTVNVCNNYNGTITTLSGTCTGVPSDPVAASYVMTTVDITYTYKPFIAGFKFPGVGINYTLGNKTIHRRTEMRRLQ